MSDGTGALAMRDLTEEERTLFLAELGGSRKDTTVAVLLCLFLGGLGAHRFYLGQTALGILYICCFIPYWLLSMLLFFGIPLIIPFFVLIVEAFLLGGRVRNYNERTAQHIAARLKALRTATDAPPAAEAG
ncbi:MAG: NINE protein [Acidobacteria bacterium]|nr:NINE protein [Acidobacteriota bacterium]